MLRARTSKNVFTQPGSKADISYCASQHLISTDQSDRQVYNVNADAGADAARRIMGKLVSDEQAAAS